MSRTWCVAVVALMCGCTTPNPRSCADGACTDPALPFCDVDGAIGGTADTCVAVSCMPNEHASCRGDVAVRCNADGTNYDLVECMLGCSDALGGCAACATNSDCDNLTPICEGTTSACRACNLDSECESSVCDRDSGRCLESTEVQYASPIGQDAGSCSSAVPCSLPYAITQASADPLRSTVRLAPGRYTRDLLITSGVVKLVGYDASSIGGQDPINALIQVNVGATLQARGLRIDLARDTFSCGAVSATGLTATVRLTDVAIDTLRSGLTMNNGCTAVLRRTSIIGGSTTEAVAAFNSSNGSNLDADALRVSSMTNISASASFAGMSIARITNSVFVNAQLVVTQQAAVRLGFSTIVYAGAGIRDTGAMGVQAENNVILGSGDAIECTVCTNIRSNIVFPQIVAAAIASNTVAEPQFVDTGAGDYHLKATSPAVNAAMPSAGLTTDHDYDGTARPQGPAPDIGAFERAP